LHLHHIAGGAVVGAGEGEDGAAVGQEQAEARVVRQEAGLRVGLADVGLERQRRPAIRHPGRPNL
jgi:hypothetical protein